MFHRTLLRFALTAAIAVPAVVGTAGPALAAGSVANSCAVTANVIVYKKTNYTDGGTQGYHVTNLPCGAGTSNAHAVTVARHPYYVQIPGRRAFCRQAGQLFYPHNSGNERTVVITPTVRCS